MRKLRNVLIVAGLVLCFGSRKPCFAVTNFAVNDQVSCSTTTATVLLSSNQFAMKTIIVNNSGSDVLIGNSTDVFSTSSSTGTARLPAGSDITLDSIRKEEPWTGSVYCLGAGSSASNVTVIQIQ